VPCISFTAVIRQQQSNYIISRKGSAEYTHDPI